MLRYIMRRKWKLTCGTSGEALYCIDGDAEAVELDLRSGGFDENTYDHKELVGVQVMDQRPTTAQQSTSPG